MEKYENLGALAEITENVYLAKEVQEKYAHLNAVGEITELLLTANEE